MASSGTPLFLPSLLAVIPEGNLLLPTRSYTPTARFK